MYPRPPLQAKKSSTLRDSGAKQSLSVPKSRSSFKHCQPAGNYATQWCQMSQTKFSRVFLLGLVEETFLHLSYS